MQKEDWQLVKRFQLIQFGPRYGLLDSKALPPYEDDHKLQLFRNMRFADKVELHYDIHEDNQISIPILKLHYRHIEFTNNTTLDSKYNLKFSISYRRIGETTKGELVNEIALPLTLLMALVSALVKANNSRKRRFSYATSMSTMPLASSSSIQNNEDFCHFHYFTEFLLHLISYMAVAFLFCFLLHVFVNSIAFLSQHNVKLTLPIVKDQRSLELIIYAALILKVTYTHTHTHTLCFTYTYISFIHIHSYILLIHL